VVVVGLVPVVMLAHREAEEVVEVLWLEEHIPLNHYQEH
jgi:hypothetical protein